MKNRSEDSLLDRVANLVRAKDGPLTRELVRSPGRFGLGQLPERTAPTAATRLVCGYCSTGCGLVAHTRDGSVTNVSPSADHPVNFGMACPKGWEALRILDAADRATQPLLRGASGSLEPVSWPRALDEFVSRFRAIRDAHGGDACAFLSTGQIATEEMLYLGALGRFGMGFAHADGNTRQCMATAATAYKESFGFDAPPFSYEDFEQSDVIVLVGSNLCVAHPIMWERICRNPHDPTVVVVDPRRTETAMAADHHYPLAPKSDLAFFNAIANVLIAEGWIDRDFVDAHTEGYELLCEQISAFAPEAVEAEVGIEAGRIRELARVVARGERVSFWWTMGVNQSHQAVRVAQAIINLALLTGNIGRPGTGANSITGQCNAMGSRLFSNTASMFCGRSFSAEQDRRDVASLIGVPLGAIPASGGLAYDQIVEGILEGRIRGLWMIATNGAHSWIDQNRFQRALDRLDFLVVQDMYHSTETAQRADLLLPAAGWGEKDGTFINSERRLGLIKKVSRAPGQALSDFNIFRLIAEAWGCDGLFDAWKSPEDVFGVMRELSRGRFCDITGIEGYEMLDRLGGVQWPFPEGSRAEAQGRRLFGDGVFPHPDGRARLITESPEPPAELPDAAYPYVLMTGRGSSSQWHTESRTGKSSVLRKLSAGETRVEISPADAQALDIREGMTVVLRSRRGSMTACAAIRSTIRTGQLFVSMHDPRVNRLTYPAFDPHSRQPSYKHCAVLIERAE